MYLNKWVLTTVLNERIILPIKYTTGGLIMLEYNPETHVAVPKGELAKLETARVKLFAFLDKEEFFYKDGTPIQIHDITEQIWKVANRLKWEE
jgi:hypothetical protein